MESTEYQERPRQPYLDEFLGLRCAGDVLNIAAPIQNARKEITESMSVLRYIRKAALSKPMTYTLYDMCAGNALTSLIAIHLLPLKEAVAVDHKKRKRKWDRAKRFEYLERDIRDMSGENIPRESIIIGVHACQDLAEHIIRLYNESHAKYLVLMPCCIGRLTISVPDVFRQLLGKYKVWCWQLASQAKGQVLLRFDQKNLSPANGIIYARR